jgi:ectoine hydroxylase-related dioxygenase (phytanoyl-CoA dioxygenase family)
MSSAGPSQLPDLSSEYCLSADQIDSYRQRGHILLREVCTAEEMAVYREIIVNAAMRHNRETRPLEERDTYGKAFLQVMNLWTVDEGVRQFTLSRRFAGIAAQLMEVDRVRLYHDQALFKEPGGGHTPWHQDQFYWPLASNRTITMWMPLVDITADMGSMSFADGSHAHEFIPIADQISDSSESFFSDYCRSKGYEITGGGAMRAGDATFHSGWTLHRAPGNVTDRVREVMTIITYPDGTTVHEPRNDFQAADHRTWLNSVPIGSPADGPLNPLLYP